MLSSSGQWGASVLQGIADFVKEAGPWHFLVDTAHNRARDEIPPDWSGDGVIGWFNAGNCQRVAHLRCPVVNVAAINDPEMPFDWPRVATDLQAVASLAAEHLLDRGFQQLASVTIWWPSPTGLPFRQRIEQAGKTHHHIALLQPGQRDFSNVGDIEAKLENWLDNLPKPIGILAENDMIGRMVLQTCHHRGIAVPDEVAVVGQENDKPLCELASPPLSSIALGTRKQGYEAAALLAQLMQGQPAPAEPRLIPPLGIVTRQSSDIIAVEDPEVAQALRFIRQRATRESITTADVLREVPVSRRSLEQRFRKWIGRSPAGEIRRLRLEHAKTLLLETNMPLDMVAPSSGFTDQPYMTHVFKKDVGMTPRVYRQAHGAALANIDRPDG